MDKISGGWDDDFSLGLCEPDEMFMSRLNNALLVFGSQGLMERVKSDDLFAIIKSVLVARIEEKQQQPKVFYDLNGDEILALNKLILNKERSVDIQVSLAECTESELEVFDFKEVWLKDMSTPEDVKKANSKFSALVQSADNILKLAIKSNKPDEVKKAKAIWCKLLIITGEENEK